MFTVKLHIRVDFENKNDDDDDDKMDSISSLFYHQFQVSGLLKQRNKLLQCTYKHWKVNLCLLIRRSVNKYNILFLALLR